MSRHESFTADIPCSKPCGLQQRCSRVLNKGQVYRCATALAEAYGVKPTAVYQALRKHGHTESIGRPRGGRNHKRMVSLGTFYWPSITKMAADLQMGRSYINRLLNHDPQRLLALVMKKKTP